MIPKDSHSLCKTLFEYWQAKNHHEHSWKTCAQPARDEGGVGGCERDAPDQQVYYRPEGVVTL